MYQWSSIPPILYSYHALSCILATDVPWPLAAAYYATWVLADALDRAFKDGYDPLVDGSIIQQYIVRTKFVYVFFLPKFIYCVRWTALQDIG